MTTKKMMNKTKYANNHMNPHKSAIKTRVKNPLKKPRLKIPHMKNHIRYLIFEKLKAACPRYFYGQTSFRIP